MLHSRARVYTALLLLLPLAQATRSLKQVPLPVAAFSPASHLLQSPGGVAFTAVPGPGAAPGAAPSAAPCGAGPGGAPGPAPCPAPAPAPAPGQPPSVSGVHPESGSLCGGTKVTISGHGFSTVLTDNNVQVGGKPCPVTAATTSELVCVTPAHQETVNELVHVKTPDQIESAPVTVEVRGITIPHMPTAIAFKYAAISTPIVSNFGPVSGQGGDLVTFEGQNFGEGASVIIGGLPCAVRTVGDLFMQCVPEAAPAGLSSIAMHIDGKGNGCPGPKAPPMKFLYALGVQSIRPEVIGSAQAGSFGGGGGLLRVVGQGLQDTDIVTLCETSLCERTSPTKPDLPRYHMGYDSFQSFSCRPGRLADAPDRMVAVEAKDQKGVGLGAKPLPETYNRTCALTVTAASGTLKASYPDAWTYSRSLTPEIHKVIRGTDEKTLEVHGWGFGSAGVGDSPDTLTTVKVGGIPCTVTSQSTTKLVCEDSQALPGGALVSVNVPRLGDAVPLAPGLNLVPRVPAVENLPQPVPTVMPSLKTTLLRTNVNTPCREEFKLTDCPGGWRCCARSVKDGGIGGVFTGVCAPMCASFLQRPK